MAGEKSPCGGGLRYDAGKNRLDLIPPEWFWGLGVVMTQGAKKYEDRNWEQGMPWSKCWGPALRHAFKWLLGERYDEETGCHHLLMVAWNVLALFTYDMRKIGMDDLKRPAPGLIEIITAFCQVEPDPGVSPTKPAPSIDSPRGQHEGQG